MRSLKGASMPRSDTLLCLTNGRFALPACAMGRPRMAVGMRKRRRTVPYMPHPTPTQQSFTDVSEGLDVFGLARHFGLPVQDALKKAASQGWVKTEHKDIRIFYPPNTNKTR